MDDHTLRQHEKDLHAAYERLRFQAPNPRDYSSWDAFYKAQAEHEKTLQGIQAELDSIAAYFNDY